MRNKYLVIASVAIALAAAGLTGCYGKRCHKHVVKKCGHTMHKHHGYHMKKKMHKQMENKNTNKQ